MHACQRLITMKAHKCFHFQVYLENVSGKQRVAVGGVTGCGAGGNSQDICRDVPWSMVGTLVTVIGGIARGINSWWCYWFHCWWNMGATLLCTVPLINHSTLAPTLNSTPAPPTHAHDPLASLGTRAFLRVWFRDYQLATEKLSSRQHHGRNAPLQWSLERLLQTVGK